MVLHENGQKRKEGRVVGKSTIHKKEKEEYIGARNIREILL